MLQPCPFSSRAGLDDLRVFDSDIRIEQHAGPDAMPVEDLRQPPDANPGAIAPPAVVQRIGYQGRGRVIEAGRGAAEKKMLDVEPDVERDPGAGRLVDRLLLDDRAVVVQFVVHAGYAKSVTLM